MAEPVVTLPDGGLTVPGNRWELVADRAVEPPAVTVVVAHYEQPRQLARTLAALARQTHPRSLTEVVVADDGSRVAPVVPDGVRVVRQDDRGFRAAAARNRGAQTASGRVLAFLDADTAPEPAYLERLVHLPALLPEVLVAGRRRHALLDDLAPDAPLPPPAERRLPAPSWLERGYAETRDLRDIDETSCRFVISAVLACSTWLFETVGGFDATFVGYGGEDWDLAHRVFRAGGLLAHEPAAVAWHEGPDRGGRPPDPAADLDETLAVAARIGVPGLRGRGLLLGAPEVAVTAGPGLDPTALVVALDDLLAALPQAHLLLTPGQARGLSAEGRLRPPADLTADAAPYGYHLHLHHAVRARREAWVGLLDRLWGRGAHARVDVVDGGVPLLTAVSLPAARRQRRWDRDDLFPSATVTDARFRPVPPGTTLAGHLGGWQ